MKTLKKIDLGCYAAFFLYAASAVVTPICLPQIALELQATLTEGGSLETGRTLVIILVLFISILWGHRKSKTRWLGSGFFMMAAGFLVASFSRSYFPLLTGLIIAGFGGGFTEALGNPLVQDLHTDESGRYLNMTNAFYSLGVLFPVLLFGELLTRGIQWRTLFQIMAAAALGVGWLFHSVPGPEPDAPTPLKESLLRLCRAPLFWLYALMIFLAGGIEAGFTFWSASYIQSHLTDLPRAGAFGTAAFGGAMALGRIISARISHRISLPALLGIGAISGIAVGFCVPLASSLLTLYGLLVLAGFCTATLWPSLLAVGGEEFPEDTTRLFILMASLGIAGYGLTPLFMGIVADFYSFQTGFRLLPGLFSLLALLLILTYVVKQKRRGRKK